MRCAACGTENEAGRKFCGECGAALARGCPSCGAPNAPGVKFCGECGTPLAAVAAAPLAPPPPTAERRLVSVLFADLVGFTALSEARDSEDVRELQSRYFDTCRRLIELYGGTVEKFIGDAVMAVWGTPVATEDDAERAVRAALDLVAAVAALGDEAAASELRARVGVLTGEAAVTLGAEGEGMVTGDLVNTASRIQSLAEPGQVLVGDATRRATEPTVAYEDAGTHELKGKVGLTPLFRALRVVSGARGALKSQGLEAPFVGRDRELRLTKDLFHDCERERRAQLVSITGIAGIGKSRLSWEFYKYFDGIAQITYWHRGRCLSYGEGVTYWALADMVRMRARIAEDEDPVAALALLRDVVAEHFTDEDERRFVEPRLAHLLGLAEGSGYERDDLFAAWRLFFERLADVYPVVMAFEDMQWADDSLLDFVEYLLEWSRSSPICVVTLARPDLLERRPTWGAGRRNFASLYLEPLSAVAMEELLTGLVPGLPEEIRAQILQRAEGIPLYAVETVRMLLDRGALVQEGAVYRPTGPIEALAVPETLHALIAARLDGLPAEERRLLQDAAVLGKTFMKRALAGLSGLDHGSLDALLASLVRKEVLGVQSDPRSPERGQYGFLQELVRHVAYETLSKHERRSRHLAAAAHLEETFADEDEVVEVLASHYLDAYRAVPDADDAEAIKAKARETLRRAGDRAASLAAASEAQRYFVQAAELTSDAIERAGLLDRAGEMAWKSNRVEDAQALSEEALAVFTEAGLMRPAAGASGRLAELDWREGRPGDAVARVEQALAALAGQEADADVAAAEAQLGRFLVLAGNSDQALPHLELALEQAEALKLPEVFAQALTSKALIFNNRSRLEEARILLEGAIEFAIENDLGSVAARAMNNLAVVFESQDRYADAITLSERALEHARRVGDRGWEQTLIVGDVSAYVLLGRWDDAKMIEADAGALLSGSPYFDNLLIHLAEIHCRRGDAAGARSVLDQYAAAATSEERQARSSSSLYEAMVLRAEGKPRAALEAVQPALDSGNELGVGFLTVKLGYVEALESAFELGDTAKVEELLATIESFRPGERAPLLEANAHRFRSKLDGSEAGFQTAEPMFRELAMPFWLALTLLEHGELLAEQGRSAEAEPLLAEAREIFERLRAPNWVERVDATLADESPVAAENRS